MGLGLGYGRIFAPEDERIHFSPVQCSSKFHAIAMPKDRKTDMVISTYRK